MIGHTIGIVGATGAVGVEIIGCLATKCSSHVSSLRLFASSKSAGKSLNTWLGAVEVEAFDLQRARECDVVFLAVSSDFALQYSEQLTRDNGPHVIDNSSAFRYEAHVPLVIPEINAAAIGDSRLIANPNCTTAIAAVVLWPLHQRYQLRTLIMSTYQASSGAGAEGMDELLDGTKKFLSNEPVGHAVFAHPLPFNVIPQIDKFQENGYTKEEMKVVWETRKIFSDESLVISCTAVRIPILRVHSESISLQTACPIPAAEARELLKTAPGVRVVDDPSAAQYPMPLTATRSYEVEVGRIRQSLVFGEHGLELFVAGDQLLRGAALNAVLIYEKLFALGKL